MAKDIWRTYVKLHLGVFNLFVRLFGLLAVASGAGSIAWGLYYFLHSDLPSPGATVTGSFAVDYLVSYRQKLWMREKGDVPFWGS